MKHLSTLLTLLMLCAGVCRAETSTLTFTAACGGSGTADDGTAWTVSSDASESVFDSNRGIHYGTGSAAVSHLTLTTSGISGTITQIKVNAAGASGTSAKLNVTVGGAAFGTEQSLTATATEYTLTGSASGTIVVTLSQTSAQKALYVKSIEVTYTSTVAPPTFRGVENNATSNTNVTLTMATATTGASIYYTKRAVDDQTVSTSDLTSKYSFPITYSEDGNYVIYAAAYKGGQWSAISSIHFTIDKQSAPTPSGDYVFYESFNKTNGHGGNEDGFDYNATGNPTYDNDGWTSASVNSGAQCVKTGSSSKSGNITTPTIEGLTVGVQYVLTFKAAPWKDDATSISLASENGTFDPATLPNMINNQWTEYEVTFTPTATSATITFIPEKRFWLDEVKLSNPEQPLTTVTGLSELKQQEPGTTVRLSLPDDCNARVLTVHGTDTYVRDNSGAILFHGDMLPTRNLKYNQHLAGWIVGKYSVNETTGMPQFEPVEGKTNTAFLVIADPVTEATTEATAITADEYDSHLADWVAVNDVRVGVDATITDGLEKGYTTPYDGALVDLSAIVAGTAIDGKATYFPLEQNGLADVTYVVDAKQEFVKPDADLNDVAVRYKRTFAANVWTPLTLPFDLDDFDGKVMEFSGLEQGEPVTGPMSGSLYAAGNMLFTQASGIEAGKPYLVKPNNDITVMTFGATTLSSAEPQRITHTIAGTRDNGPKRIGQVGEYDEYSFVGVYTPTTLSTDRSQRFMDEAGGVDWVDGSSVTVDGTTAYFEVPGTQGVHLKFADDTSEPIITVVDDLTRDSMAQRPTGIYNLLGVKMHQPWSDLPRGIYIVNGKKVVK